jgi:hypothetical protein
MNSANPEPSPTYLKLRSRILSLNPTELGLEPSDDAPRVWGVLVEIGYEVGTASLVSLADGTTSLYYSTGGGMLGSGDYQALAEASRAFVNQAENHFEHMSPTAEFPLPEAGQVRFILLTYSGAYSVEVPEKLLLSGDHLLSPLFERAQQALAQLRLLAEKKRP